MKTNYSVSIIASIMAFGLLSSAPARADIAPSADPSSSIDLKSAGYTYGQPASFSYTLDSAVRKTVGAGSLSFATRSPSVGSFASYCVELGQSVSNSWATYTLGDFSSTKVASSLAHLYQVASAGNSTALGTASGSAAFQAAVWEIVYETSATYSLTGGNFTGSFDYGRTSAITKQASAWLNAVNNFSGASLYKAQEYVSGKYQDQLVITAVPEPESYALFLAGLGLMAAVARRRKSV